MSSRRNQSRQQQNKKHTPSATQSRTQQQASRAQLPYPPLIDEQYFQFATVIQTEHQLVPSILAPTTSGNSLTLRFSSSGLTLDGALLLISESLLTLSHMALQNLHTPNQTVADLRINAAFAVPDFGGPPPIGPPCTPMSTRKMLEIQLDFPNPMVFQGCIAHTLPYYLAWTHLCTYRFTF